MTNMIQEIKSQIAVMIDRAMEKAVSDGVIPCKFEGEILVEKPREKSHGDYATNVAMQMAKAAKKNPRALAQDLLDRFDFSGTLCGQCGNCRAWFPQFSSRSGLARGCAAAHRKRGVPVWTAGLRQRRKK